MARRTLQDMPRFNRPREKLKERGVHALSDTDLLAIILAQGVPQYDVLSVAGDLVRKFPKETLLTATLDELREIPGVGEVKAGQIIAMCEYARRLFIQDGEATVLDSTDSLVSELHNIRKLRQEHFIVLSLSARRSLLSRETVAIGSANMQVIEPRDVFFPAIKSNAIGVVLAHNHPSGDPTPSQSDLDLTNRLISSGDTLGVHVLDHIILTTTGHYSFHDSEDL